MNVSIMGTHGVGKTTTIELLRGVFGVDLFEGIGDDHGNPIVDNVAARQLWRLGKYISDYTEAKVNDKPGHEMLIHLIDRCPYDWDAYTTAFLNGGQITRDQYDRIWPIYHSLGRAGIMPEYVIFIHPPEEWVIERIQNRWNEEKKKWNEGDFDYLRRLRKAYEAIVAWYGDPRGVNCQTKFLLVTATDRQERVDQITNWLGVINPAWKANRDVYEHECGQG